MGRTQLNFRLNEEQKDRWEAHVEESAYYDTVSDFLKQAAREQIERDSGDQRTPAAPEGSEPSGELLDRIQDLQNDIHDLQGNVGQALDALHSQEGVDPDLPPEVYSALPAGEASAQTAEEIADTSHISEAEARFALENLVRSMGDVHRTPEGNPGANEVVRWYREE